MGPSLMETNANAYGSWVVVLSHFLGGTLIKLAELIEWRLDEIVRIDEIEIFFEF